MPDQNQNNPIQDQTTPIPTVPTPSNDDTVAPVPNIPVPQTDEPADDVSDDDGPQPDAQPDTSLDSPADANAVMQEVATKINESNSVLIALSSNPTADEMSAAIGLSLCLEQMGKRATAIYSGATPSALGFLNPEDIFEISADTLQDFVIAINKEKADHLRYKLDGDFVKIFITPYKTRIGEEDLDYSYGDFNIDLTLALDIKDNSDLDVALRDQARMIHNATVINISTDEPGKFGEIEWNDKTASSISEMVARLMYAMKQKITIEKEEATAFLAGIISATDRFSKANTTPETMQIASQLMTSGANQQLISENITADMEKDTFNLTSNTSKQEDDTSLSIDHEEDKKENIEAPEIKEKPEVSNDAVNASETPELPKVQAPFDLLKPTDLSEPEPTPEPTPAPMPEPTSERTEPANVLEALSSQPEATQPEADGASMLDDLKATEAMLSQTTAPESPIPAPANIPTTEEIKPEKTIAPSEDFVAENLNEGTNKYGQMLEDALAAEPSDAAPVPLISPEMSAPAVGESIDPTPIATPLENSTPLNPAMSATPEVPTNPDINGVPEINYMPLPGDEVLPPPPAPPIDMNSPAPAVPEVPEAPAPQPQPTTDPSAFQIPGA